MFGTRKLGRTSDQRKAMLRAMTTYLLENGKMETTFTRAKEVQPVVEKMITLGKKNGLANYRKALSSGRQSVAHTWYITNANQIAIRMAMIPPYQRRVSGNASNPTTVMSVSATAKNIAANATTLRGISFIAVLDILLINVHPLTTSIRIVFKFALFLRCPAQFDGDCFCGIPDHRFTFSHDDIVVDLRWRMKRY